MPIAPDAPFPSFFLSRVGGGTVHVGGPGPALIFFFRADCRASSAAARAVARIADELMAKGLRVIGVSQDDEGDAAAFAATHGLGAVELCVDGKSFLASSAVELAQTPTAFLVDEGRVVAVVEGWVRHDYNALAARAAQLVGAEAPFASGSGDGLPEALTGLEARNVG